MSTIAGDIIDNLGDCLKKWTKQRKAEERHESAKWRRLEALTKVRTWTVRDAAWRVMEKAYMKASSNNTLPAEARQIMYAARNDIQKLTDKTLDDKYFTQTLLPDYLEEHDVDWDVVFDDRGHFSEPHTDRTIGLGTVAVREYLKGMHKIAFIQPKFNGGGLKTLGPDGCYKAILFIEKEGFLPLFEKVHLAERFDIAVMSTKGHSVTAARKLVDEICGNHNIPLLLLHDFDKSGFSIAGGFQRDGRRYKFKNKIKVIDLGLRMADIEGLQDEKHSDTGDREARANNLRKNGATEEEVRFLLNKRVELNAMTSDQLVAFVERKLTEHGIKKVVPHKHKLSEAYRLFERGHRLEQMVERELKSFDVGVIEVPDDIEDAVNKVLLTNPSTRWIDAVEMVATRARQRLAD
jgi:hypothetical protein